MGSNHPEPGCEPGAFTRRATRPRNTLQGEKRQARTRAEVEGFEPSPSGLEPQSSPRRTPLCCDRTSYTSCKLTPRRVGQVGESGVEPAGLFMEQVHHHDAMFV